MADRLSELLQSSALPRNHWLYMDREKALKELQEAEHRRVTAADPPIQTVMPPMNLADLAFTAAGPLLDESGLGNVLAGAGVAGTVAGLAIPGLRRLAKHPEFQRLVRDETGTSNLSALSGIFAPQGGAVRGETSRELRAMQKSELSPRIMEKAAAIAAQSPEIKSAMPFMTPAEVKSVTIADNADAMGRMLRALPAANKMASLAKAGAPKQGWYRASSQALIDVFGKEDAPRFAALLAATSPQNSVEANLQNTLNIWKNWTAAGRPVDEGRIKQIMGMSVQGTKGADSVLPAWVNNSITALTTADPRKISLSGYKVDSFYRNLADDVYAVTNDAWMSNALGVSQGHFGTPGGYGATSARIRQGGQIAGMHPREAQETMWSVAMPWLEGARSAGIHPREYLQRGMLTPEAIRGTPDFSTLLKNDPKYRRILDQAGYGDALDRMSVHEWGPLVSPELSMADQRNLDGFGGVLGELLDVRGREKRSHMVPAPNVRPERVTASMPGEVIPYTKANHLSSLVDAPWAERKAFTSDMRGTVEDAQGHNVLHRSVELPTLKQRNGTGMYQPPGEPREVQPTIVSPVELEVTSKNARQDREAKQAGPDLYQYDKDRMDAVAAAQGALFVQGGSTWNAGIRHETGPGIFSPAEVRVPESQMLSAGHAVVDKMGRDDIAMADTGGSGMHSFPYDKKNPKPITREEAKTISSLVAPGDAYRPGGPVQPQYYRTWPVGGYIDYEDDWLHPGEGRVVTKLFDKLRNLTQSHYNELDKAIRDPAGRIADLNMKTAASRKDTLRSDVMNMLNILRTNGPQGGLEGLKRAYQSGQVALPALTALASVSDLLSDRDTSQSSPQQAQY